LEIVGRGCLKIYSANEDDTGTYTCRAENLLDSVDSDASLVVLGTVYFETSPPNNLQSSLSLSETKKYIFYILRLPLPTISNLP
jgi:hypothetical protein